MKISWCRFNQIHRPEFSQQNDLTTAICKVPGSLAWVYKFETSLGWTECVSAVEFKPHTHTSLHVYTSIISSIYRIYSIFIIHTHKHFDSLWYMYIYIYKCSVSATPFFRMIWIHCLCFDLPWDSPIFDRHISRMKTKRRSSNLGKAQAFVW